MLLRLRIGRRVPGLLIEVVESLGLRIVGHILPRLLLIGVVRLARPVLRIALRAGVSGSCRKHERNRNERNRASKRALVSHSGPREWCYPILVLARLK